jgi:hydroxyacylglutathione hydrolase
MSGKPMTTLAFEKRWNPVLALGLDEFVNNVSESMPDKPANMQATLHFNQGRAP